MYDAGKVIAGLLIFLALVTIPFWYGAARGTSGYVPTPELPVGEDSCVESTEYMRSFHMDLLNQWRDAVVREGNQEYISSINGKRYEMSLTNGCMSCHVSKVNFCDQCHNYAGVSPYCWDCHVAPAEPVAAGGR